MAKRGKGKHDQAMAILREFDPKVAKLADARYFSGRQLFDGRTHRLRAEYVDKAQARAILIAVQRIGETLNKPIWLSKDEQRLLNVYSTNNVQTPSQASASKPFEKPRGLS
jgi:hypothetical protein